jgi:uncharacterized SAM-binding protein YcdF (DUF218 family)
MSVLNLLREFIVSLTYPPSLTLLLLAVGGGLMLLKFRRLAAATALVGVAWSVLWSLPVISESGRQMLERRYPVVQEASALPTADAIVVLGGGSSYRWMNRPDVDAEDLQYSRLAAGARAWKAGRAPVIILSGGGNKQVTEAERMAEAITRLGVPRSALRLEEHSNDTRDNAFNSMALAGGKQRHVLLVTSSLHMPRAAMLFREAGAEVTAVPVPEGRARNGVLSRWVPSPRALWRSGRALKEYLALVAVCVRR